VATMVRPDERSAANGVSNIARSFGLCFSPIILGVLMVRPAHSLGFAMPFHIAGTVKLGYDFLIWVFYRRLRREGGDWRAGSEVCLCEWGDSGGRDMRDGRYNGDM
jgi:hypothetical protein